MRPAICLVPVLAMAAAILSGCGYAGEPKPPALRRPERVANLAAAERGSKIVVTFVLPRDTMEALPIRNPPDIEMRIGATTDPWDTDAWAAKSDRVPVPAWQPLPAASSTVPPARAGSTAAQRRNAARQAAAAAEAQKEWYSREIEIDAAKYAGKTVAIGVRVHGPKGRDDGWSFVPLAVLPPLAAPRDIQLADAPGGVHLQWTADAPAFRIFRKLSTDADWTQIGESTQPSFDDKDVAYGKAWEYSVQSVRKVGDKSIESEQSAPVTFTPVDRFPPATPTGLTGLAGAQTIELSWNGVADADLAGYRIYRGGVKIADGIQSAVYSDKAVTRGSRYSYQVSAVDQAGNESTRSMAFEITME